MKKTKQILMKLPEYYLLVLVILSGYTPPFSINPIVIGFVAIVILQIIFKNKISGLIVASLFLLINLYMFLALLSENNEFPILNGDAKQLFFVGVLLLVLNLFVTGLMMYKYLILGNTAKLQIKSN